MPGQTLTQRTIKINRTVLDSFIQPFNPLIDVLAFCAQFFQGFPIARCTRDQSTQNILEPVRLQNAVFKCVENDIIQLSLGNVYSRANRRAFVGFAATGVITILSVLACAYAHRASATARRHPTNALSVQVFVVCIAAQMTAPIVRSIKVLFRLLV